jgi:hypothetical protein
MIQDFSGQKKKPNKNLKKKNTVHTMKPFIYMAELFIKVN